MVPYFGRHSAKMFIRGKPIRFGYKIWSLCGEDGYPYHLKIYTGKEPGQQPDPLGTRVVNHMVSVIEEKSDVKSHQLFFDNFFSSYGLLKCLREKNVRAVGTIRENRTAGASKLMESAKDLKTAGRGKFDYRSDGKVYICKWNDNSVVSVASNWLGHLPLHQVRRRVKNVPDTQVTQPHLIHLYNKGMGGVDLMDRLLSSYRPMIRGKKWYWPLFINALNITIVAAWRAHCAIEETRCPTWTSGEKLRFAFWSSVTRSRGRRLVVGFLRYYQTEFEETVSATRRKVAPKAGAKFVKKMPGTDVESVVWGSTTTKDLLAPTHITGEH